MRIIWACRITGAGTYEDPYRPAINDILDNNGGAPCVWQSTSGLHPQANSIGIADVSQDQLDLINAAKILNRDISYIYQTIGELKNLEKKAFTDYCEDVGITVPENNETVQDVLNRLLQAFSLHTVNDLVIDIDRVSS